MITRMSMRSFALFLISLALMVGAGCGYTSPQEMAARAIKRDLPSAIGPAENYTVSVNGDAIALLQGRAKGILIHGTQVQVTPDLTLDDLEIDARGVLFDKASHRISRADSTKVTVALTADDFTRYLQNAHPAWSNVQLAFQAQDARATLPLTVLNQETSVSVVGHFQPDSKAPSGIDLKADSAAIAGIPLPAVLVNLALDHVNPIINLNHFKYPVTIQSTAVTNGRLVVSGSAQL